jgi:formate dehydrogenase subunit gamma
VTTTASPRASATTVLRFDAVQRTAHWLNAALFLTLMFTGLPLYFGSFFGVVFPRHTIQMVHLWTGLALPLPVALSLVGPWGRLMRDDWRRIGAWTRAEVRWLRTFGRSALVADKFNPGQKFNAIFTLSATLVLFVTGYILQWFRFFPVSWRNGATITHDLFAFAAFAMVSGHVIFALANPASLRSMFGGRVREEWARHHAAAWIDEDRSGQP